MRKIFIVEYNSLIMKIITPFDDDNLLGHQSEGILAGCFKNDYNLGVTSRFGKEASSLVRGLEERYSLTKISELFKSSTDILYHSLVIRVLNDVDVFCGDTREYLDKSEATQELFRISSKFGGCRSSTVEIGLAALLIQRAVQKGYLQESVRRVDERNVVYLSLVEQEKN